MWSLKSQSTEVANYLDRMLLRTVDLDLPDSPTSQRLDYSHHRLVCARFVLGISLGFLGVYHAVDKDSGRDLNVHGPVTQS